MTRQIRAAIKTLSAKLRDHCWGMYNGTIRCSAIADTEGHAEVTLCPLAMAVTCTGTDRIEKLLDDPEHESFAELVRSARPGIREQLQLEDPRADPEILDLDATVYAAATVVHDGPQQPPADVLLDLDADTLRAISSGADHPDSEVGRALVRALDSESNELRREYEAAFGKLPAAA